MYGRCTVTTQCLHACIRIRYNQADLMKELLEINRMTRHNCQHACIASCVMLIIISKCIYTCPWYYAHPCWWRLFCKGSFLIINMNIYAMHNNKACMHACACICTNINYIHMNIVLYKASSCAHTCMHMYCMHVWHFLNYI